VPSVTETLSAWKRTPIACTRFCERPDLLHVGGTKNPTIEQIVALAPDLVVLDKQENRKEDYDALLERGVEVHVLDICSLEDVNPSLTALASIVDAEWDPLTLPMPAAERFSAFVPIWRRPWMALGSPTYASSVIERLGVRNIFSHEGPYPQVELNEVLKRNPDVVLAPSEPYKFTHRHLEELETMAPTVFVDGKDLFWWGVRTPGALKRLSASFSPL
jgi:ABC-type Fe3+-hydroxamate transport system substrate-binding protein